MTRDDLEKLDSIELQKVYEKLDEDLDKLREKERKLEDFKDFINYLLPQKKYEEHIKYILSEARKIEDKAIELLGGQKYVFFFGGYRYIPIKKTLGKKQLSIVEYNMCNGVGIVNVDYLYEAYKRRNDFCLAKYTPEYEYSEFYKKSPLKKVDLFYCLDNGLVFIPTTHELMHVNNETLKNVGLYEEYAAILSLNETIK